MHVPTQREARRAQREAHCDEVIVTVRCARCQWRIAELYGDAQIPVAYWSHYVAGGLGFYGRTVRWRCRCGMDYPLRAEKLAAAYAAVAGHKERRQRVIVLPNDVRGT